MTDYKLYQYDEISKPLRHLLNQILKAKRKKKRPKALVWKGPDSLHHSISATSMPPSYNVTDEGLEYHAERGRDALDVFIQIAIQLGFHQGVMVEGKHTKFYADLIDTYSKLLREK